MNVTSDYHVGVSFTEDAAWQAKWTEKSDGYYYYKYILLPGQSTEKLFTSVTITEATPAIPNDYQVKINVLADTIQAVSDDSAGWTAKDISVKELKIAWGDANNPTLTFDPDGENLTLTDPKSEDFDDYEALSKQTDVTILVTW